MKEYCYFKHDSNARNDDKLLRVRMKHGAEGYGVFWMLLERLREEEGYMADTNYAAIAYDLHVDERLVGSIVEDFDLFIVEGGKFWSENLRIMMREKDAIRAMNSEKAKKRWANNDDQKEDENKCDGNATASKNDATAMPRHTKTNATAQENKCDGNATASKNDATAMPRHEKSEQVNLSLNKYNLNITPPTIKVVGVQGEEGDNLSQKPQKTAKIRGTLETVTAIQRRLIAAGCIDTDIDRFVRLTDLGTDDETEVMIRRVEDSDDSKKELARLNEIMAGEEECGMRTRTTCYSAVKATVMMRIVDDDDVRERIIDTFRTGTLAEKAKASNRVVELADEIRRKKGTDREIVYPARYIAKMLGISI